MLPTVFIHENRASHMWRPHLLLQTLLAVRNMLRLGVVAQEGGRRCGEQPVSSAMTSRSSSEITSGFCFFWRRTNNSLVTDLPLFSGESCRIGEQQQTCGVDGTSVAPRQRSLDDCQSVAHVIGSAHGLSSGPDGLLEQPQYICGGHRLPPHTVDAPGGTCVNIFNVWLKCKNSCCLIIIIITGFFLNQ